MLSTKRVWGMGPSEGVNDKDNAVYHFKDTLYFTAEICMARGIDDVDFCIFIKDCRVFWKELDSHVLFRWHWSP